MKFKLFGRLMKSKPKDGGGAAPAGVQKDRRDPHMLIDEMKMKGMAEADVIRVLKEEGYSFKEIDDALNESLKSEVTGEPPMQQQGGYGAPQGQGFDNNSQGFDNYGGQQQGMGMGQQQDFQDQYLNEDLVNAENQDFDAGQKPMQYMDSTGMSPEMDGPGQQASLSMPEEEAHSSSGNVLDDSQRENVYEIVESVVNERLNAVHAEIKEINEQIKSIQQIISEFKNEVHESNESHIKEMGSTHDRIKENMAKLAEIEPRVAGVERAFKDIVPNLVDSVREVKEIVNEHFDENVDEHVASSKKKGHDIFDAPEKDENEHHRNEGHDNKGGHEDMDVPEFDESDDDERI